MGAARRTALHLNAERVGLDRQVDTYFTVPTGRFKLRESSLSGAQLIPYLRSDESGPKLSEYALIPVSDVERVKNLLRSILGTDTVVEKEREIFLVGNVRVHLDRVKALGEFVEFEAVFEDEGAAESERAKVRELMDKFGITDADLVAGSYRELVARR